MTASQADADALFQAGRLSEAAAAYRRILALAPADAAANRKLGILAIMSGHFEPARRLIETALAAEPGDAETWVHHGVALQSLGRDAGPSFERALVLQPGYPEALFSLAALRDAQGRLDEAAAAYAGALKQRPDFAEAHNNLANILARQGKLDKAAMSFTMALAARPDYAEAHNNFGNLMREQGLIHEAMASYAQALALQPGLAEAHNNMGNALKELGKPEDAAACYRRALAHRPDYTMAADNLALLLSEQGQSGLAMQVIRQSLKRGETLESQCIFAECAKHMRFTQNDAELRSLMARALTTPWGRPGGLVRSALGLAMLDAELAACVDAANKAWPERPAATQLFALPGFDRIARDPLMRALLTSAPLCDIALERFLTLARHALLELAGSPQPPDIALDFFSALARQCFIDEYVFDQSEDETRRAEKLRDALAAALDGSVKIPALWVIAAAAYAPLAALPQAEKLLERSWPAPVAELLTQQVREPRQESQEQGSIPQLGAIDDATSLVVRRQYEENPFPRWVRTAPTSAPKSMGQYFSQKFPLVPFQRPAPQDGVKLLIAGCGTGQQAIEMAWEIDGAQILAVDLSLASLAYAKRKTGEAGLHSIAYAQADLLNLPDSGPYDIIACVGVLHHLADPLAGWRKLLTLLRPGGFMKIGLYSALARQPIAQVRGDAKASTAEEIRRFRQGVMARQDEPDFRKAAAAYDFYSLSMCRDLFFHVQEQCFSLGQIEAFLHENDLMFLGFDMDAGLQSAYRARFADDPAAVDLEQWQRFENDNPDSFTEMYQFWIQKP